MPKQMIYRGLSHDAPDELRELYTREDIPNTFAPGLQNKTLSISAIRQGLGFGFIKHEKLPPKARERLDVFLPLVYEETEFDCREDLVHSLMDEHGFVVRNADGEVTGTRSGGPPAGRRTGRRCRRPRATGRRSLTCPGPGSASRAAWR